MRGIGLKSRLINLGIKDADPPHSVASLRRNCLSVLELSDGDDGAVNLLRYLTAREGLGLIPDFDASEAAALIESECWKKASTLACLATFEKKQKQKAALERTSAEEKQAQLRRDCAEREKERRSFKPPLPKVACSNTRGHSRKLKGEVPQRLEFRLDSVLKDIRHRFEDESSWEEPEFPYELAHQILDQLTAENYQQPMQISEPPMPTASVTFRAPERPGLGLEASEPEAQQQQQTAWDALRNEANDECLDLLLPLRSALKQTTANGTVQLSAADCSALAKYLMRQSGFARD